MANLEGPPKLDPIEGFTWRNWFLNLFNRSKLWIGDENLTWVDNILTVTGDAVVTDDLEIGGTLFIPPESTEGMKVGDIATGTYGWDDITSDVTVRGTGAANPTWSQVGSSVIYAYKFSVGDECWMDFHLPHDLAKNTDIYMHCHWMPDGTNTQPVKWQFEYAYANGHNQAAFPIASLTTTDATQTVGGTQYQHYITESAAQTITGMEPDGMIAVRITRITNGGTENTDGIFLLTADIHYQSTGVATLNRAPNFYGT